MIIHNAYASISCNYQAWFTLMNDAQSNIFDILRELDMRSQSLLQSYGILNQSAAAFNYDRLAINNFYLNTSNSISQLRAALINFNQTLIAIDSQIQAKIDQLTNITYLTCIDAIQDSIIQNKSCVPDILQAQLDIFAATSDEIKQCSHKFIDFNGFNYETSLAFRIPTKTLMQLIACTTGNPTKNAAKTCLNSVFN